MRIRAALFVVMLLAIGTASWPALAAKRVAFIVGNDAYAEIPKLAAAVNDARAMRAALTKLGFEVVLVENGSKLQISRALSQVESRIEAGDAVVFHFAGHGFEIDGQNWLLPVDVPAAREGEAGLVKDQSFNAADVIDRLKNRGAATVVAILDACRNNPFARTGTRALGGSRGLARMDPSGGVFILFSAGAKQEALDKLNETDREPVSVFARSFIPLLDNPDLSLIDLAKETQDRVVKLAGAVGHEQVPAYYDGVRGRITLLGNLAVRDAPPRAPEQPAAQRNAGASEDLFWSSIKDGNDPAAFEAYIAQVERGTFAGTYRVLAEMRIAALRRPAVKPDDLQPRTSGKPAENTVSSPEIEACDRAAAAPADAEKPVQVPGVDFKAIAAQAAIGACLRATQVPDAPRRVWFQLGRGYLKQGNSRDAARAYSKAADLGHPVAMHNFAILLMKGDGVARDLSAARVLFEKAAEAGLAASLHEIGAMYQNGTGTPKDYRKARFYLEKAVTAKEPLAYANLGNMYLFGQGVPTDRRRACAIYSEGASLGDRVATSNFRKNCRGG